MGVAIPFEQFHFQLESADEHPLSMDAAIQLVGRYLTGTRLRLLLDQASIGRANDQDAAAADTFAGGTVQRFSASSIARGETLVTSSGLVAEPPVRAWAMHHRYPAFSNNIAFHWSLDVGVEEVRPAIFTVLVKTSYGAPNPLLADALKPESDISMWEVLGDSEVRVSLDGETLHRAPTFVGTDVSVQDFITRLQNPDRQHLTLALISRDAQLDMAKVLSEIAGHVNVYVPVSASIQRALVDILPLSVGHRHPVVFFNPGLGLHGGSLMTELKALHPPPPEEDVAPETPDLERQLRALERQVWQPPAAVVEEALIRIARFPTPTSGAPSVSSLGDLSARIQKARFERLRADRVYDADLLALYEEELVKERHLLREATGAFAEQELAARTAETRTRQVENDLARMQFERQQLVEALRAARSAAPPTFQLISLPRTLEEVLVLAGRYFEHTLVVTERALKSATSSRYRDLPAAWDCLRAMSETLHPLYFEQKHFGRVIGERFRASSGLELTAHESESTRANPRTAADRTMLYHGESVDISPHVKVGRSKSDCLRAHYYVDRAAQRIVIGHFGDHLQTATRI